ncbi:putative cytoplasmic protein [Geitlerinema sp. FC II]|nr:putative cytoplasmic protein [Geitlerinema sp. FC II]
MCIDHDRLFKTLLSTFFWEFLDLFFPAIAEEIDRDSITFLPQEVFTDITSGERREIDVLVRAKFRQQDSFFLIHTEAQASAQTGFARRMFRYFARLDEIYGLPVYPIALLSYDIPKRPEPDTYTVAFLDGEVLKFRYRVVQLNRLNWRDFLRQPNPVAAALMSKMQIAESDRPKVKAECLRLLVTLRLDPAKTALISGFVDTYLRLNAVEQSQFKAELKQFDLLEEERTMEIITSWMERGIEQGLQQGLERGREREISLVLRLLDRRLGEVDSQLCDRIRLLPLDDIEALGEALLDFETEADLIAWLSQYSDKEA